MNSSDLSPSAGARTQAGTGRRKRGQRQIARILEAAKAILIAEGYAAFTMRNVARRLAISPGTLTYYFKQKEDLFKSLFEDFLRRHEALLAAKKEAFPDDPLGRYEAYVSALIEESRDAFTRVYFYQLWAVSSHDPFVESLRKDAYDRFLADAESFIRALAPKRPARLVRRKAFVLCAMIEGLHVMAGAHASQLRRCAGYEGEFHRHVMALVQSDGPI